MSRPTDRAVRAALSALLLVSLLVGCGRGEDRPGIVTVDEDATTSTSMSTSTSSASFGSSHDRSASPEPGHVFSQTTLEALRHGADAASFAAAEVCYTAISSKVEGVAPAAHEQVTQAIAAQDATTMRDALVRARRPPSACALGRYRYHDHIQ